MKFVELLMRVLVWLLLYGIGRIVMSEFVEEVVLDVVLVKGLNKIMFIILVVNIFMIIGVFIFVMWWFLV